MNDDRREMVIPFPGLYETSLSVSLDNAESNLVDYLSDEHGLDRDKLAETVYFLASYGDAHRHIAKLFADEFAKKLKEEHDVDLGIEFSEMVSPKYYNFTTDRIFVKVPLESVRLMRSRVSEDCLKKMILRNHTSRDGFASFYSNNIDTWREKPLDSWDHNELATLLDAFLDSIGVAEDELIQDVELALCESEAFDDAIDKAVPSFEVIKLKYDERNPPEEVLDD